MSMINTKDILETIKMIEEEHLDIRTITMGISLRDLAADDVNVLADKIYDNEANSTRFIIVTNQKIFLKNARKVSICFEIPHQSGSLYQMISHFIFNGINMTKIESRPIQGKNWEYRFFIDIEGNLNDGAVQNALNGLSEETSKLKILGNY